MNGEDGTETARWVRSARVLDGDQPDDEPAGNLELIVASMLRDGDEAAVGAVVEDVDGVTEAPRRPEIKALPGDSRLLPGRNAEEQDDEAP
jgi:hypothetical protein